MECNEKNSFQVPGEFIEDLENEMRADEYSKRIEKTKEDRLCEIYLLNHI